MRRLTLATLLVLYAAETRGATAERCVELSWIPSDAESVLWFGEGAPAAAEVLYRLRDELLFATGMGERLPGLSRAVDSLGARRLVAAVVRIPGSGGGAVAVVHGSFSRAAAKSSFLPAGGSSQTREGLPIHVAAPRAGSSIEEALAFVDEQTAVFGELRAVERCLALRSARGQSVLADRAMRPLLDEAASQGEAWGILLPRGERSSEPPKDAWFPYHGVREGLAGIRWWSFSASVSSGVEFHMRTRAGSYEDAFVLADALRAFLASFRLNPDGAPAVLKSLEVARVSAEGPTVSLHLDLSAEAIGRLRHNEASRRLLSWRLGPEERESRERLAEILVRLEISRGDSVADVGSGLGFYTVALARTVGATGRVFAVDIDERVLGELKRRVAEGPFPQVEVILGAPDDPKLPPESLDAALIVNSYHEMPQHKEMLEHLWRALRPGGRLMLVEPFSPSRRKEPRRSQVEDHLVAPEIVEAELRESGFEVLSRVDAFVSDSARTHFDSLVLGRRPQSR